MTTIRRWLLAAWHTRPGHRPHGMVVRYGRVYCAACGTRLA